ncbi:hypothetical protein ACFLZZ_01325 [Nanoarchaeota archaeon]
MIFRGVFIFLIISLLIVPTVIAEEERSALLEKVGEVVLEKAKFAIKDKFYQLTAGDDWTKCNEIEDLPMRNLCLKEIAIKKKDASICEKIENPKKYYFFEQKASMDSCFLAVAVLNKGEGTGEETCNKIDDRFIRWSCKNQIGIRDPEPRKGLGGAMLDWFRDKLKEIKPFRPMNKT